MRSSSFNPPLLLALALAVSAAVQGNQAPADVGELFATEATAKGPELLAGTGMNVASGAQASAGKAIATLRLNRGGEIKLCPHSSINASALATGGLMLSMNASTVELNYPIDNLFDTLITPDFSLMLVGPGVFHFAVGVSGRGDTCIRPLLGNSSSIIVRETMGNGIYQVRPDEAVLFSGGKLSGRYALTTECGCPAAAVPVTRAANAPKDKPAPPPAATAPAPQPEPGQVHVQVDAPLVFHGDLPAQPTYAVAKIRFSSLPNVFLPQEKAAATVLTTKTGDVSQKNKEKKGFFGHLKSFFSSIFKK